ncbi:MAG: putative bifunctional diguanylate cyclase/phosphodiesterase [Lautropia sp.]
MNRASPLTQDALHLANLTGSASAHARFVRSRAIAQTAAAACAAAWYAALGFFDAAPRGVAAAGALTILACLALFLVLVRTRAGGWPRDRGLRTTQLTCATATILACSHFLDSGIRLASLFWIAAAFAFVSYQRDTASLARSAVVLSAAIGLATAVHTLGRAGIEPAAIRIAWLGWVAISAFLALLAHVAGSMSLYRRQTYRSRAIAEAALASMSEAVLILDQHRRVVTANAVAVDLLSTPGGALPGASFDDVARLEPMRPPGAASASDTRTQAPRDTPDAARAARPMRLTTRDGREVEIELTRSPLRTPGGTDLGEVVLLRDVGAANGLMRRLEHESRHDALTGLLNRTGLLEVALQRARTLPDRAPGRLFMVVVDLDEFKLVNDTCGHRAGDQLLLELGTMLRDGGPAGARVARLGGDEFAVAFEASGLDGARRITRDYLAVIEQYRFYRNHQVFRVRASAGLAEVPAGEGDPESAVEAAIGRADSACYLAKELGRNRMHVYSAGDDEIARRRRDMSWAQQLRDALENERFVLMGQRIAGASGDRADELEVLLRLIDDEGNLVSPGAFMPAAERFNLMGDVDRHVTRRAVSMLARSEDTRVRLSINLSAPSLQDPAFPDSVATLLAAEGVDGARLCFEITETVAITNLGAAGRTIAALQALGCRLALDDVGTGFSSFGYLKTLKVDRMKIDGSFVKAIGDEPVDRIMVESLHKIAKEVGIETVAEMVEHPALISQVRELGIDLLQGFAIHRPEPLHGLLGLARSAARHAAEGAPGAVAASAAPASAAADGTIAHGLGVPAASQQAGLGLMV